MTQDHKHKLRRVEDILDSMRDAIRNYDESHCHGCRTELETILTTWDDNPQAMDRELVDFAQTLRLRKLQKGCHKCHPPVYRD